MRKLPKLYFKSEIEEDLNTNFENIKKKIIPELISLVNNSIVDHEEKISRYQEDLETIPKEGIDEKKSNKIIDRIKNEKEKIEKLTDWQKQNTSLINNQEIHYDVGYWSLESILNELAKKLDSEKNRIYIVLHPRKRFCEEEKESIEELRIKNTSLIVGKKEQIIDIKNKIQEDTTDEELLYYITEIITILSKK